LLSGSKALERLRAGNARFVSGEKTGDVEVGRFRPGQLVDGQQPFAVILGCSDSRVPVEIIFDQGPGDLFVVRVAGNVIAPATVGSIEFAAQRLGARLIVVLGHSQCGAIQASLDELVRPSERLSPDWAAVIDQIRPTVAGLLASEPTKDPDTLMHSAVRANARASAGYLRNESGVVRHLVENDGLLVLAAEYSLETGMVDIFDGVPKSG
jgi:carbonic anhydrase